MVDIPFAIWGVAYGVFMVMQAFEIARSGREDGRVAYVLAGLGLGMLWATIGRFAGVPWP